MMDSPRRIPADPLKDIFSEEVLARLRDRITTTPPGHPLSRYEVVMAESLPPDSAGGLHQAFRDAWRKYLSTAFALGLFDDPHGADLRARLTDPDDDMARAAMKECMVGWVLACKLNLALLPRPEGRKGRVLEYLIAHPSGEIRVEVKAPFRYRPPSVRSWSGDDADRLAQALREANDQFERGVRNLLVLAPDIRIPVFRERDQLIHAFYGQHVITVPLNMTTGTPVEPTTVEFDPDGRFLNTRKPHGGQLKPDGMPAFTRVGAVLCIEEAIRLDAYRVDHKILLAHNPFGSDTIPHDIWGSIPQLIEINGEMIWTDERGHPGSSPPDASA